MKTKLSSLASVVMGFALVLRPAPISAQAVWNQAMSFRGAGDYVAVPDAAVFALTNNYTLECWFRAEALGGTRGLISKFHSVGANGFVLRLQTNHLDFDGLTNATVNLQIGVWYHVAAVNSNGVRFLYLNGQALPLAGTALIVQTNTDPLCFGVDYLTSSNRFFKGRMDEVRIWNAARSQAEIQATMNASLSGSESNLAAYYRFNEPGGVLARDGTVNLLHGTLVNRPIRTPSYWWPTIALNSADPLSTECHKPFVDPTTVNGPVVAIAVGGNRQIALRADGSVAAFPGVDDVPAYVTNVVAIAAGSMPVSQSYLALRADGTLLGWGDNSYGQITIPAGATNAVAIAMGKFHSLALRSDGSVVAWGGDPYGQGQTGVPVSATNIVAIAAGDSHSLALRADGTVLGWGLNATPPAGLSNVVAIAAGIYHSLALKADGSVVGWGNNSYGQTTIPGFTNFAAIAAGEYRSMAIMADGSVICWGETGGSYWDLTANVVAAGTSWNRYVTLHTDGNLAIWHISGVWPEYVSGAARQTRLAAVVTGTVDTNAAGSIFQLGYSVTNEVSLTATNHRTVAVVDTLPPVIGLNGDNPMLVVMGSLFADPGATASDLCGGDMTSSVETNNTVNTTVPGIYTNTYSVADSYTNRVAVARMVVVGGPAIAGLSVSNLMNGQGILTGTVNPNGDLPFQTWFEWGPVRGLQYAYRTAPQQWGGGTVPVALSLAVANLVPGVVYHYRLVASNEVWVSRGPDQFFWIPAIHFHQPPLQIVPFGNAWTETTTADAYPMQLTAGIEYAAALKADGTVGKVSAVPGYGVFPADATNLVAIGDCIGLRADGYVVGWGISNVVAIAGNGLALKEDGTVVNRAGAVVASDAIAVAEGMNFGLAARRDGTVVAWGYSDEGQGVIPPEATNVIAVAAGWFHGLALRADGTVIAWGANVNDWGQTIVPAAATNVIAIAAGAYHNVALRADGTVVAWGGNTWHQCDIAAVTNVIGIGAGYLESVALTSDGRLYGAGDLFGFGNYYDYSDRVFIRISPTVTGTVNAGIVGRYPLAYAATNAMGGVAMGNRIVAIATSPVVTTELPTGGGSTAAQMNGTVNPRALDTTAWFEYGLLPNYGNRTADQSSGFGTGSLPFGSTEGLLPWITYHYRAVASNELGRAEGSDVTYTVPGPVAEPPVLSALTNVVVPQGGSGSVGFIATPADVNLAVSCNNPILLPESGLTLLGSGTNRSLLITPAAGQSGSARISVTASNSGGAVIRRCTVTVTPPAGGVSSWVQLSRPEGSLRQTFRFQVLGAGADATNFAVEHRSNLSSTGGWDTVSDAVITPQGGGIFQVDAPSRQEESAFYRVRRTGPSGASPQLLQAQKAQLPMVRFQIVDLGSGSTNYALEFRSGLSPTNLWMPASNAIVTALSNGIFQVEATAPPGDMGFYRIRGSRSLTASLTSVQISAEEGAGTIGPVIVFNGIYTGTLTCVWSDATGAMQTNQIAVNGTTAVIPVPSSYLGEDDAVGRWNRLTLELQGGSGFALGDTSESIVTILDNDSNWHGVLQAAGCTLGFGLTMLETNGMLGGRIQSDSFGFFPTNALVQISRTGDSFTAVATNIPVVALAGYPALSFTNYVDLRLDASNSPGALHVTATRIEGAAALVMRVPTGRHLDSGLAGTFALLMEAAEPVTNNAPLQPVP